MCFQILLFGKWQHYPCKYPNWICYFLETLQSVPPRQSFSLLPILVYYMKSELKCILSCAEMQNQTEEKF